MTGSGCDIIIPIWNQLEYTKECIDSIFRNTACPYSLILVDNGSGDETRGYLDSLKSSARGQITVIRNDVNAGFVRAVNQGMKISGAPYVCILNNDTVTSPGWLERMIKFAESHPDVGLINPQCDGHGRLPIDEYAAGLAGKTGVYMEMNQCQGFAMLVRRELIDRIGYLDESFGIGGYDDTDYSMRAHLEGYRSVSIYDSYVYHRLHVSFNKAGNREALVRRNRKIYEIKWGRHLRVGIAATVTEGNKRVFEDLVRYAYGLAREWTWVHIWVNSIFGTEYSRQLFDDAIRSCGYPMHQNIRIQFFRLPDVMFKMLIVFKAAERSMNPRKRDKAYDAVLKYRHDERTGDWEAKGSGLAMKLRQGNIGRRAG